MCRYMLLGSSRTRPREGEAFYAVLVNSSMRPRGTRDYILHGNWYTSDCKNRSLSIPSTLSWHAPMRGSVPRTCFLHLSPVCSRRRFYGPAECSLFISNTAHLLRSLP